MFVKTRVFLRANLCSWLEHSRRIINSTQARSLLKVVPDRKQNTTKKELFSPFKCKSNQFRYDSLRSENLIISVFDTLSFMTDLIHAATKIKDIVIPLEALCGPEGGYRGIALLFHDRGTRSEWVISSTPRPHFTPGKDPVPSLQEARWAPGPVWTGGKSRPNRDSILDRPARSSIAIPTELPDPNMQPHPHRINHTPMYFHWLF